LTRFVWPDSHWTTGVIVPQTDTATASVAGNYVVGEQSIINDITTSSFCGEREFDMVSQGTVEGGVLTTAGDVSDRLATLLATPGLYPGSTFNGILPWTPPTLDDIHHSVWQQRSMAQREPSIWSLIKPVGEVVLA
jgi:hypothetical protein